MASSGILNVFARSPVRPLQQHIEKALECAQLLSPFFEATLASNWESATAIRQQIIQAEHDADELKMDFRTHLPKSLLLPFARADLLDLLAKQELIPNTAKDITGIVLGRHMEIPAPLVERFKQYVSRSVDAAKQAHKAINELDELLESGFRGREVEFVNEMVQELNTIEHDTDELQVELRQALFSIEQDLQPVDVMFLYRIIEYVGLLADSAQQAGNRLRMLFAD